MGDPFLPSSPTDRYERYGRELELALSRVVEWAVQTNAPDYDPQDPEGSQAARDEGLDRCLELYYYWINFSPLSRCFFILFLLD